MVNKNVHFILILSCLLIVGCSTAIVETRRITSSFSDAKLSHARVDPPNINEDHIGVVYYLPKALIPISIQLNSGSSNGAKPASTGASAQVTNSITNQEKVDSQPKPPSGQSDRDKGKKKYQYTVTLKDLEYFPDTSYPLFLEHNQDIFFEDDLDFEIGANQLLKSINTESTDKTGEVLVNLIDLAGTIAKMSTGVPSLPDADRRTDSRMDASATLENKYVCDPLVDNDIKAYLDLAKKSTGNFYNDFSKTEINNKLIDNKLPIRIEVNRSHTSKVDIVEGLSYSGVFVRSPIPYVVTVTISKKHFDKSKLPMHAYDEEKDANVNENLIVVDPNKCLDKFDINESEQKYLVMAPNDGPITRIDISRSSFITKTENLTISNGMLSKIDLVKPSQALGFIRIPVDMVKAIAEIPASIFSLKVENKAQEAGFYESQANILDNIIKIQANQEKLNQEKTNQE